MLREYGLFAQLFPAVNQEIDDDKAFADFVRAALKNTDKRVDAGMSVTPMFLLGVFFWAPARRLAAILRSEEKMSESQALSLASYELTGQQQRRVSIPRRFTVPMREMIALQPRFTATRGKRAFNLLEHRRFRAAYDFMILLAEVGQFDPELARFWTDVQKQSPDERAESFQINRKPRARRRSRRRRRRPKAGESS